MLLSIAMLGAAVGVCVLAIRASRAGGGSLLLTSIGTLTIAAVAQSIMFWWIVGPMDGSDARGTWLFAAGIAMWVGVIAQWMVVAVTRSKRAASAAVGGRGRIGA